MNIIIKKPFEVVLANIKTNILDNGFLLIHEINTKEILRKHGYEIQDLRQLLFFHPEYMNVILENDIDAVIKVPLKIVVREEKGETVLTYVPASELFGDNSSLIDLGKALDLKIQKIISGAS